MCHSEEITAAERQKVTADCRRCHRKTAVSSKCTAVFDYNEIFNQTIHMDLFIMSMQQILLQWLREQDNLLTISLFSLAQFNHILYNCTFSAVKLTLLLLINLKWKLFDHDILQMANSCLIIPLSTHNQPAKLAQLNWIQHYFQRR